MIILALWWGKFSSLGILKNHDVSTLRKNLTLTPLPTLIDKFLQKLKLEPCESFRYLFRMLSDSKRCFAFAVHEFSTHGHGCSKLTRQSKIHEQSIHSTAIKTIIETSWEYISVFQSMVGNTKRVFTVLTFWFCTNCAARNFLHTLTFQPIPWCCRNLQTKANMFCIIRASYQTR